MEIRELRPEDAEGAAELLQPLQPSAVTTVRLLLFRQAHSHPDARKQSWVALDGGAVVGFASAELRLFGSNAGNGHVWVGVRADMRRRGIGTALAEAGERHLLDHGASVLETRVERDSEGARFAAARGYDERVEAEVISMLAVEKARLDEFDALAEAKAAEGFRLAPLREVREREEELFGVYVKAGAYDGPARVTIDDWRRDVVANPELELDGSAVVVAGGEEIAALSFLVVDGGRRRAENEYTATLPELRGRRLALLAKLATLRWARDTGIREVVTENALENQPMLMLNQRLGYRPLHVRDDVVRRI